MHVSHSKRAVDDVTAEVDPEIDSGAALFKQYAQDAQSHGRAVYVEHADSGDERGGQPAEAEMEVLQAELSAAQARHEEIKAELQREIEELQASSLEYRAYEEEFRKMQQALQRRQQVIGMWQLAS